jgi:membrane protein implicated in regulation of membrane protease activity
LVAARQAKYRTERYLFRLMSDPPRAQLIHIDVDRRLGHEWDEWDGNPLPNAGDYDSAPVLFLAWSAGALLAGAAIAAAALYLLGPRLALVSAGLPPVLWIALAGATAIFLLWLSLIALSYALRRPLLPEMMAERGPLLRLMRLTSRFADRFGRRDWVENAAVKVYNALALERGRKVGKGELLLLIPRCLSKETLDGVLAIAGRYEVPVFVATRGQLARRVIRERRQDPCAGPHDDPPLRTVQGCAARPVEARGLGEELRGLNHPHHHGDRRLVVSPRSIELH